MATTTILVLGATGKTGRRVAQQLRAHPVEVRAASRRGPARFDWQDEGTWAPALDGVGAAYLVDSQTDDAAERLGAFGELAVARGVERLVLLSARDWGISGDEQLLAGERALQRAGAAWTILRPAWFAQNFSEAPWLRDGVLDGELALPTGDGQEPFVDAEDIAAVAVAALTAPGHAGETYELSGPRLLSFGAAVGEIAAATGREIRYVPLSAEQHAAGASERGTSAAEEDVLSTLYRWIAEGRNAHLSDGVQRALGRAPRDFGAYVAATAAVGGWDPRPASAATRTRG